MTQPAEPQPARHSWGKLLNEWHDEVGPFHLLRDDGSPRCGVPYRSSTGAYPYEEKDCHPRCGRCEAIDKTDERGRESQKARDPKCRTCGYPRWGCGCISFDAPAPDFTTPVSVPHPDLEREAQAIPSGCIHGSGGGTCPPIPGCCRCGGSGRVDFESDDFPPGTNACCCTCTKCRERVRAVVLATTGEGGEALQEVVNQEVARVLGPVAQLATTPRPRWSTGDPVAARKAARELYSNPDQSKVLDAIETATSLVFLAEVESWERGTRGRVTVHRHLLRRRAELEGPRYVPRAAPRGKWGIWDQRDRYMLGKGDGGLSTSRFDTEAEAAQVAARCETYADEV